MIGLCYRTEPYVYVYRVSIQLVYIPRTCLI
jgi:hypothetical protein